MNSKQIIQIFTITPTINLSISYLFSKHYLKLLKIISATPAFKKTKQ